jgi:exonuclease III
MCGGCRGRRSLRFIFRGAYAMNEFLKENWLKILQIIIIPFITVFWTKKTICLSTADDVIKLKEYKAKMRDEKRKSRFYRNLYVKCYQNQKIYKGWHLCDFQEFGNIKNRGFRVSNENNEYLTIGFPQDTLVRRYGYDPNDSLSRSSFMYKPNFIERLFCNLKSKFKKGNSLARRGDGEKTI